MRNVGTTILLVEDEVTIRELLSRFLERANFTVLQARDGIEGLSTARERRPDIIILDNVMPKMSGVEMFRALRASAETRGIPVLFATACRKPCDEVVKGDDRACVFQKPFLLSDLVHTLRSLIPTA